MLNTQLRYILVAMVSTICLQCVSKTPKTQNINSAKALNKKYQLNITSNLVLPLNKAGLDSLKKEYLLIVDRNAQVIDEEREEDDLAVNEKLMSIYIPYAFNDLVKRGFKPISAELFEQKLTQLGLNPTQRKKLKGVYEHPHYFTFLIAPLQVTTDEEQKKVDEQEAKCIKIAGLYHFYVKGYNFIAMPSMLESFIKQDKNGAHFSLDNELVHYNCFLLNNNKFSLSWLCKHNKTLLFDLVKLYGYDKNETINKLLLKKMLNLNRASEVGSTYSGSGLDYIHTVFSRKVQVKSPYLVIHKGLFETLMQLPLNNENKEWTNLLNQYGEQLVKTSPTESSLCLSSLNDNERFELAAYTAYYLIKLRNKYKLTGDCFYQKALRTNRMFRTYLEKVNYLGLSVLKK